MADEGKISTPNTPEPSVQGSQNVTPPEAILRHALGALQKQNAVEARRGLIYLEKNHPDLSGLDALRRQVVDFEERSKRESNIRSTEEMLLGYIQQRKKPLATFALETLLELVPDHPKRGEYEIWIKDLDQEVALQERIQQHLRDGRSALQAGRRDEATKNAEALKRLDPDSKATLSLAEEIAQADRDQVESKDIDRLKKNLEELLERGDLEQAHRQIEELSHLDVPKITLDFLRQRVASRQNEMRRKAEMEQFEEVFDQRLQRHDWVGAREVADMFSERFPESPRAHELYDRVNGLDAADRREQSKQQGIATLEQFIAAGQRREAELALQVLRNLDIDPQVLAALEQRVQAL